MFFEREGCLFWESYLSFFFFNLFLFLVFFFSFSDM